MMDYLGAVFDAVVERESREIIGAFMIGLALAVSLAGLYALLRRKVSDILPLLAGMMLLTSIASMAVAVGYLRYLEPMSKPSSGSSTNSVAYCGGNGSVSEDILAWLLVRTADGDLDGVASAEEVERITTRLIERANVIRKGSVDPRSSTDTPGGTPRPNPGPSESAFSRERPEATGEGVSETRETITPAQRGDRPE